ncbi:STAS domain-containing protein [Lentzea cavernae]|uniref:Anti-sigma factor antagonist n=1 Tax=Lentzea cavernae TaxID=2020703 RepID=A0ABQ3MER0_9PSEU|nr:STAS domain-containing protein [Lentzea cavernae]GHH40601.1 hypothetical protein GCM10017774_34240 [Lentzea cavernae]
MTHHGGIAVLVVTGEIDMFTETTPRTVVADALKRAPDGFVIDLRAVTFFGSSGINLLLSAQDEVEHLAVPFAVVATRDVVLRPLSLTGVDVLLPLFPSLPAALAAVRTRSVGHG